MASGVHQSLEPQRRVLDGEINAVQVGSHHSSRPTVLFLPGTQSVLAYYTPLLVLLGQQHITGLAIDLPGFGSPVERGSVFDQGVIAINRVIRQLVSEGARSVLPVGLSFGGAMLGAFLAERRRDEVPGAVLISPIGAPIRRTQDQTLEGRVADLLPRPSPGPQTDVADQLEILKRVCKELDGRFRTKLFTDLRMLWMWGTVDWFLDDPMMNVERLPASRRWHHELLATGHIPTADAFPFLADRLQAFRWELVRNTS